MYAVIQAFLKIIYQIMMMVLLSLGFEVFFVSLFDLFSDFSSNTCCFTGFYIKESNYFDFRLNKWNSTYQH